VTFVRDQDGLVSQVQHSGGYQVAVDTVYTSAGMRAEGLRLLDGSNGGGGSALLRYGYDPRGRLVELTDSTDTPFIYEYDDADRITAWIDRCGYRFEYEYDDAGRVMRTRGEDDYLSGAFEYRPDERVTVYTDSLGNPTEYHYDEHGHVRETVDPLGGVTVTEYDAYGRLLSYRDQCGNTTSLTLDAAGDPIAVSRPDGTVIRAEYNALRSAVRITHADGAEWHYTYDERGNLVAKTDPLGATDRFSYDERGRLTAAVDPLGQVTAIETDRAGLPLQATDPLGAAWLVRRDARGRVVSAIDPLGAQTETEWGAAGRPVLCRLPDGTAEAWEWDANGQLAAHVDPAGQRTVFENGSFGRIRARTDADGARYAFTYDTELRLTAVTGPTELCWRYRYDPAGNLAAERDFNGRETTYSYDATGRLASRVNGAGQRVELIRDEAGRVIERRASTGPAMTDARRTGTASDMAADSVTRFEYDRTGRLIRAATPDTELVYTRDPLGRVLAEAVNGHAVASDYDPAGRRLSRTTPTGRTSSWTYDAANRAASVAVGERRIEFGYDAAGRETHRWIGPSVAITSEWDALDRISGRRLLAVDGAEQERRSRVLEERLWQYRADGMVDAVHETVGGTRRYQVDPLGRITAVQAADWSETYAYDRLGNLVHSANTRMPDMATAGDRETDGTLLRLAGRTAYEYDDQGRLVSAVRRTLSGKSISWQYTYDPEDRLVSAMLPGGAVWRYRYDALGRRVAKQHYTADGSAGPEIRFSWDGAVLAEQYSPGLTDVITVWDYEPGSWTPVAQERRRITAAGPLAEQHEIDVQFHAIVPDLLGTPAELVEPDGTVAWRRREDLWGARIGNGPNTDGDGAAPDCPLGFPGQYLDPETGLHYNFLRYYDPQTARYLTSDPIGLAGSPNPHGYVLNPLSLADPVGLKPKGGKTAVAQPDGPEPIRIYEPGGKHGPNVVNTSRGVNSKEPVDGQAALDRSVQIKPTALRRIGVDENNGEIVILDRTRVRPAPEPAPGAEPQPDTEIYHGHVRSWDDMSSDQGMADARNTAMRAGLVDKKGNIKPCP
jgi:RHS repeat-associated protein